MDQINWNRVLLGGLLAGLIINASEFVLNGIVLEADWAAVMKSMNKPSEVTPAQIVGFNVWGFTTGIIAVWLYAAIRPRYGAGPKTAVIAGFGVWLTAYLLANAAPLIMDMFPLNMILLGLTVGIVEVIVGTMAGAWLYSEESAGSARSAAAGR